MAVTKKGGRKSTKIALSCDVPARDRVDFLDELIALRSKTSPRFHGLVVEAQRLRSNHNQRTS